MTAQPAVLVIGAGQAGLAVGFHLREAGLPFTIVEAGGRVGDSWRARYDSLTLFTPRSLSALPGMVLAGNRETCPTRDEFADYLEAYAARFTLPVLLGAKVESLTAAAGGGFAAALAGGGVLSASDAIVATGAFQLPSLPALSRGFGDKVVQIASFRYRGPSDVIQGPILVVGDGASGRDIAAELAPTRAVMLAAGRPRKLFPERVLGKSTWWWLSIFGFLHAAPGTWRGRMLQAADAFPDRGRSDDALRKLGVHLVPRLRAAAGTLAEFADGSVSDIAMVIWATGYHDDFRWLQIPGTKNDEGTVIHEGGVSPVPGLFFVGRPWQRSRASSLVAGAGPDAGAVVALIAERWNFLRSGN